MKDECGVPSKLSALVLTDLSRVSSILSNISNKASFRRLRNTENPSMDQPVVWQAQFSWDCRLRIELLSHQVFDPFLSLGQKWNPIVFWKFWIDARPTDRRSGGFNDLLTLTVVVWILLYSLIVAINSRLKPAWRAKSGRLDSLDDSAISGIGALWTDGAKLTISWSVMFKTSSWVFGLFWLAMVGHFIGSQNGFIGATIGIGSRVIFEILNREDLIGAIGWVGYRGNISGNVEICSGC